jgi:hypothetical protein
VVDGVVAGGVGTVDGSGVVGSVAEGAAAAPAVMLFLGAAEAGSATAMQASSEATIDVTRANARTATSFVGLRG